MKLEAKARLQAYLDSADEKELKKAEKAHKDMTDAVSRLAKSKDDAVVEVAEDLQMILKPATKKLNVMKEL